jgi:hypothetical protein
LLTALNNKSIFNSLFPSPSQISIESAPSVGRSSGLTCLSLVKSRSLIWRYVWDVVINAVNRAGSKCSEKSLSQCHYVHHKSCTYLPGIESGPQRWEVSGWQRESWHGCETFQRDMKFHFLPHRKVIIFPLAGSNCQCCMGNCRFFTLRVVWKIWMRCVGKVRRYWTVMQVVNTTTSLS